MWNCLPHERAISALPDAAGAPASSFFAADYDTLVDSPIVAGNPDAFEFEVQGKKHQIVNTPASDLLGRPEKRRCHAQNRGALRGNVGWALPMKKTLLQHAGGGGRGP
ncbi:MAG: hypothetical protein U5J83_01500 [Bryobacterales bacterium]|nr:hypothetical protein [Bryobacterales bacterium]